MGLLPLLLALPLSDAALSECLRAAYPDVTAPVEKGALTSRPPFLLQTDQPRSPAGQMENAYFADQLSQPYPRLWPASGPTSDPGRIRSTPWLTYLYGEATSLGPFLKPVPWAPSGEVVRFNPRHGAAKALEAVGRELAQQKLSLPLSSLGTYNPRVIAGTTRPSAHGFGIAIDLKLPPALHHYWRWTGCKEESACPYPSAVLQSRELRAVVETFERHGFIWGGKWEHFDTMHFEYRPELLTPVCQMVE